MRYVFKFFEDYQADLFYSDIYFIYVVHTLHPISYARTCREIFGTIVRPEEILSLKKYKLHTQQLWQQTFDEDLDSSYHYFLCHSPDRNKVRSPWCRFVVLPWSVSKDD